MVVVQRSRLQDELKKRLPFESPQQEALLNLLRTHDQVMNRLGRLFREYDLTPSQYNVLRILRGAGKPLPCLEIVSRMVQIVPAMTGLLDRLEARQWVSRQRCTADRRVIYVALTDQGRQLLARLDEPVRRHHGELLGHLTRAELQELSRLLEKVREPLVAEPST
jgi:DNA-binding MarR family transcriptional regulator